MANRYLENTHVIKSTQNANQSIIWYTNSSHLTLTVTNKTRTHGGGKYAEFHASAEDARAIIDVLQNYIDTSEVAP
jgi:type V secretory pathway adhesin AidA